MTDSKTEPALWARWSDGAVGKAFVDGTHRTQTPEATLRALAPLAKGMGITRIANITGLDVIGVPVVAVTRPNSRSVAVAQGKGVDLNAAKVSGLMEAIENFHAERIRAPLLLLTWEEMCQRGAVIDVSRLPRSAGGAFDSKGRILWIQGHEALGRRSVWLPFELVHTDYTAPLPSMSGAFLMSDSGVASGNHPLEAISHAVCELVERDAVTLWHYATDSDRQRTRIDLDTVNDAVCRWTLDRFAQADVRVAVWEVTSDVGIPAFLCTIMDAEPSPWRPLLPATGTGCHPCREVALSRALTEAAQTRLTVIAGSRDDIGLDFYRRGADRDGVTKHLALMACPVAREFEDGPSHEAQTLNEDVSWELDSLQRVGVEEIAIVDLMLPEYRIPVVRVVIPGLEGMHDAAGFVAGQRVRTRYT
ncbi:MAG: YcaO-like family protein [Pseudomonadota bacterium]